MSKTMLEAETVHPTSATGSKAEARLFTLTLVHHPDPTRIGERARLPLLSHAQLRVAIGRSEPTFRSPTREGTSPLQTPFVSRKPLWLEGLGDGAVRVDARGAGSRVEVDGREVGTTLDLEAAAIERGVVLQVGSHVVLVLHVERDLPFGPSSPLVGETEAMALLKAAIARVGPDKSPVLVRGETGTGKELVAAAIHAASPRRERPFIAVNMAAVAPTLASSELFGHVKGAFSGADQSHDGFFVRAHGGTLFLDEVGDTPSDIQAALLRVLETSQISPVGGRAAKEVDVRVVAATDADLDKKIADGTFRGPLFYRLAAHEVHLPPLRERRADIGRLIIHLVRRELVQLGREAILQTGEDDTPWLKGRLMARLIRYDWPGNVRQLKSVCRAMALASDQPEGLSDAELERLMPSRGPFVELKPRLMPADSRVTIETERPKRPSRTPASIGPEELEEVLASYEFRLSAAADHFGISRPSMNELIDKHPRLKRAQKLTVEDIEAAMAKATASGEVLWRVLGVSERGLKLRMRELGLE